MMDNLFTFSQGFSGPHHGLDNALFEYTVIEHARAKLQKYLNCHGESVSIFSPSLMEFLNSATIAELPFESVWSLPFGILDTCLETTIPETTTVHNAAISVAWQLSCSGIQGQWSAKCKGVNGLAIDRWILPQLESISIDSQLGILNVKGVDASKSRMTYEFSCGAGKKWSAAHDTVSWLQNHSYGGVKFLTEDITDIPTFEYLRDLVLPINRIEKAIEKHTAAMELLTSQAPEYANWVTRVIRSVIPLETKNGGINSGSSRLEQGIIHASIDCPVEGYAEMLVHEASHQYFYILRRLGRVDDGSDTTLYFSPVKQKGRPIEMILFAYHAFANVVLLGRRCIFENGISESDYFRKNEAFLQPHLYILEEGLQATNALTPLGKAIWQPLRNQLCQTA